MKIVAMVAVLGFMSSSVLAKDACLKVDYATKYYSKCCANGGYKIKGREPVCKEAGKVVKKPSKSVKK